MPLKREMNENHDLKHQKQHRKFSQFDKLGQNNLSK
jgi:hypothetical protein